MAMTLFSSGAVVARAGLKVIFPLVQYFLYIITPEQREYFKQTQSVY